MFIVDKPYVSDFLKDTIKRNHFPVIKTENVEEFGFKNGQNIIDEDRAIDILRSSDNIRLYTNSENALGWITKKLPFSDIPTKIGLFKNKASFRKLLEPLYPDFLYQEVSVKNLEKINPSDIIFPIIIKPTVGFFSFGVNKINNPEEWVVTVSQLQKDLKRVSGIFPKEVFNDTSFIIEQVIEGDEFAIDAYFDEGGDPVVLNILEHVFSSDADVSDRIYMTSQSILESNYSRVLSFLKQIGRIFQVRLFPVHVEIRIDREGFIQPIEINPMRFGGWCTTPDLAYYAYGFNAYELYMYQERPDWEKILAKKNSEIYSLIVLDNSTGWDPSKIVAFDYSSLLKRFEMPLELRKLDYKKHPVFGFLFAQTHPENRSELEKILRSNLREFVTLNQT
jgi:hypothetical protein